MLTPSGWWESRRLPGSGAGPNPDRLVIGSEGTLGVVTEAWMRIQARPQYRATAGVTFPSWEAGDAGARRIVHARLWPALRLLDRELARGSACMSSEHALLIIRFKSAEVPQEWPVRQAVETAGGVFVRHNVGYSPPAPLISSRRVSAMRRASATDPKAGDEPILPDQPRDGYLQNDGLRLHYLEWGERSALPTIVLLHHVSSHAHTWDDFARSISRDYHVLAPDLRGHGESEWAREGLYGTEHLASDVAALVDQLELDQTILLGGSLGGRVALVYAAQHPERVAALIMEDVGAVRPPNISQAFAARLAAGDPEFDTVEQWATQLRGGNERASDEVFLHLARHGTKRLANGRLGLKRDQATLRDLVSLELWEYVARIQAPFMLMVGAESEIVGEDQQQRFLEIAPHIRIEHIAATGHIIVHDQAAVYERTIREFLSAHGLR